MTQYKKCIVCELNLTTNADCICDSCKGKKIQTQKHNSKKIHPIGETFTFTNEKTKHRNALAYEVYDSSNNNIGYVFMTDDPRTPAFEHCEIHFYPAYQKKYLVWHKITSNGQRIKWSDLCQRLKREDKVKYFID